MRVEIVKRIDGLVSKSRRIEAMIGQLQAILQKDRWTKREVMFLEGEEIFRRARVTHGKK
jgi:hypothetical protein